MSAKRKQTQVSIIIVNYKCVSLIIDCVKSIHKYCTSPTISIEVLVVSNSELTREEHQDLYSLDVDVIPLSENLGFARANNIGADHAKGSYLFFLNPDTLFLNDAVKYLLRAFEENPAIGLAGPLTLGLDLKQQATAKKEFTLSEMLNITFPPLRQLRHQSPGIYRPRNTQYVEVVNGSAMFISKELFNEAGKMDESYFMFWEENDLCYKVHSHGKKVLFCKEASIIHLGGETTKPIFLPMEIHKHRSQKIYVAKHFSKLVFVNRILGIIAYSWRVVGSLILFRPGKVKQFGTLLFWYTFSYK